MNTEYAFQVSTRSPLYILLGSESITAVTLNLPQGITIRLSFLKHLIALGCYYLAVIIKMIHMNL